MVVAEGALHPAFLGAERVITALHPHPVYAVGGMVRAVLLEQPLAGRELDLCTPIRPEQIVNMAQAAGLSVDLKGAAWGCITVAGIEVTSFRTEVYKPASRHPKVQFGATMVQDAQRRDFTCNAVYLAPTGALSDLLAGAENLRNGDIVWVGNPLEKLAQDPIRWWRWLRFCSEYGTAALAQPRGMDTIGGVENYTLCELAGAVMKVLPKTDNSRWRTEHQKAAMAMGAQNVRIVLGDGLAACPEALETLLP